MTESWLTYLPVNPLPALLAWPDEALRHHVRRDLLGEAGLPSDALWEHPGALRLVRRQGADGSWRYAGKADSARQNYSLLETYRSLRLLVEVYGFTQAHPALQQAAEYVFTCQTVEGDIRGILGNQTMPYYHGALLELLIKAGYAKDLRVTRGLEWLLSVRQEDGGWIVPTQAVPSRERTHDYWVGPPAVADRSLPHAHMATGMVLRAFAAHPTYRHRPEVRRAGEALKSRLFQPDRYNDRRDRSYWLKFQYPFWWASLLTAMDSLSRLGFDPADPDVATGLAWFVENQEADGLWPTGYGSGSKARENQVWVGLAACRMLKQFVAPLT